MESQKSISRVLAVVPTFQAQASFNAHRSGTPAPTSYEVLTIDVSSDIATCQNLGKIVLLSLGGAVGTYGFSSSAQAASFATTLWNAFGEGWGSIRPFGWVTVDGFDLGIKFPI